MSNKNFRKSERPTGAPAAPFPAFIKNLNKFYNLCGSNDSEAARRIGVKPQQFNEWRKGEHVPGKLARKQIAHELGLSVHELMHGEGKIAEPEPAYLKSIDQETVKTLDELLASDDEEIMAHLKRQVLLLRDLLRYRRSGKK